MRHRESPAVLVPALGGSSSSSSGGRGGVSCGCIGCCALTLVVIDSRLDGVLSKHYNEKGDFQQGIG